MHPHGEAVDYLEVLVVYSAPVDVPPALNLAEEMVRFEKEVRRLQVPIRVRRVFPPTLVQLQQELSPQALRVRQPRVLHFLGHGEEDSIWFEKEDGSGERISAAHLRRVLRHSSIQLVFLNACWSATKRVLSLCHQLTQEGELPVAIGHGQAVEDQSAVVFAPSFYALVAQDLSVGDACRRAANDLSEKGLPGASDVELCGNRHLRLTADLRPGVRPGVVEDGMPRHCFLPGSGFFCGRASEFLKITGSLVDPGQCGFGIWGLGGLGKSRLALEVARRNAWRYSAGGVAWVDVRELRLASAAGLIERALCRLVRGPDTTDPVADLIQHLTARPGLIVFDHLDALPESEHEALARFVGQMPRNGSRVLLTAQTRIEAIESLADVRSLPLTGGLDARSGAHYAYRLALAKGIRDLQVLPQEFGGRLSGPCARVTHQVGGHPQMIEWAVGMAQKGLAALDAQLDRLGSKLEKRRQRLLAAGLGLLGEEGRRLLPYLRFFPAARFMPEAMQVVCRTTAPGGTDSPADEEVEDRDEVVGWMDEGLEQLERSAFLDFDQEAGVFNFPQALLDQVSSGPAGALRPQALVDSGLLFFYADYLSANSDNFSAVDRCADHVLWLLEAVWPARDGAGTLDRALAALVDALGPYLEQRGLWEEGERWLERIIELRRTSPTAQDDVALANGLHRWGILLTLKGRWEAAAQVLSESAALFEQAGEKEGVSVSLYQQASLATEQGNLDQARRLLERRRAIEEGPEARGQSADDLMLLARIEQTQSHDDEAARLVEQAHQLLQATDDQRGQAAVLHQLSALELVKGRPTESRLLIRHSLRLAERLGDVRGRAQSLHQMATVELEHGSLVEARRLLQRARALLEGLDYQQGLVDTLYQLAVVEWRQGEAEEARRLLLRCIEIEESLDSPWPLSKSLSGLAYLEGTQENWAEACRLLQQAAGCLERLGNQKELAAVLHEWAYSAYQAYTPAEARQLWERAIELRRELKDLSGEAVALGNLAAMEATEADFDTAVRHAREAVTLLARAGDRQVETARENLGVLEGLAGGNAAAIMIRTLRRAEPGTAAQELAQVDAALAAGPVALTAADEVRLLAARLFLCLLMKDTLGCRDACRRAVAALARTADQERGTLTELLEIVGVSAWLRSWAEAQEKFQSGDLEGGLAVLEEALATARREGNLRDVAEALTEIEPVLLRLGRYEEAATRLRLGLEEVASLPEEGARFALRRAVEEAEFAAQGARELDRPLEEVLAEAGGDAAKAEVLLRRATVLALRDPGESLALANRAAEYARRSGAANTAIETCYLRSILAGNRGDRAEVREQLRQARTLAEQEHLPNMVTEIDRRMVQVADGSSP